MPIHRATDLDDGTRRLTLSTGADIDLKLEGHEIGVYAKGIEVGRMSFRHYEVERYGEEYIDVCRLTHAFIEGSGGIYKRHGVGTEAVRFYLQAVGCQLELPDNDGIRKEDGSHLVGDGPAFIASLKAKHAKGEL